MEKNKKTEPWERRGDETAKNYEAFCVYRDLGPGRSLRMVSEMCRKSESLLARWSTKFDWVNRATLWDDENERIERKEAQEEQIRVIRKMRKRQASSGYAMQMKGLEALKKLPVDEMSAQDIVKMMIEGAKLERLGLGDVGEVVEERNGGDAPNAVTFYMPSNGRDQQNDEEDE